MAWSELHSNFLVNRGGGTYGEAIALIGEAKRRVKERFGITLEEEIKIVTKKPGNRETGETGNPATGA
jgi:UDP-N-acetylmuramate dehydrogenase